ncbi:Glycine cleavage system transcriptional activator [Pseudomonas sp. MM227]|jgi:LysR family glycine cleavage system transcriptional activator|uniref:LysR family transcriptional regulator n=1 Tax=unclassified Pseudomonas TaxID=196821 RepID=UPI000F026D39|nr:MULTISPECIES: LysR family transcriptional regulator [unclassified Pseudomonas]MBD8604818.1 LysR family transcriptional regulator [Pseudomonas sp. CFBP 8771]MBD8684503.1 LysR family transcriptional regulator [Pseudomonas sp. CFBP 13719]MBD8733427.1 LysR family transcriptional regulator [Pseudomonas sp. CFBP 13710]MBD8826037.1 LysR family transcriptional regulator [Pseudomonas sp. CFBP 13602]CAI3789414.1 Glycine cleavage system transcriptional activator [Pseudomonas sp. MM227]
MSKHVDPDTILLKMPSLRAVKAFVAAAKYESFTRAAEALCVSQAAISRQIKELEVHLGAALFTRVGRAVELTPAGTLFFDAAHLSFVNIAQAAERIRSAQSEKRVLTICCSPAFSALWLSSNLPEFFAQSEGIELNLITTQNFLTMEPGVQPDAFITKIARIRDGYKNYHLCHDLIYPVCTPAYLQQHPEIASLDGIRDSALLNLSPYGRSQVAEHVDWGVWFAFQAIDLDDRPAASPAIFNANDYNLIISMVLTHQGIALGWNHLVSGLIGKGLLVRPIADQVQLRNSCHYLACKENSDNEDALRRFREWMLGKFPRR